MILAAMLAGAGVGLGVFLGWRALHPQPPALARVFAGFDKPGLSVADVAPGGISGRSEWLDSTGGAVLDWLDRVGLTDSDELSRRLRVLEVPAERYAFTKLAAGIAGFLLPVLVGAVLAATGVPVPAGVLGLAALVLAGVGFFYPDLGLTERVEQRRRGFRHALSAYLDLVTVILAGGGGLETALWAAADSGDGWAFTELRHALKAARLSGMTPWAAFDRLGEDLGVEELRELAASAYLAGDQGARIRASLAAKADSMRANQTALIEAQAEATTEKMLLPVVALVVGMILFIGFGVVDAISTPPSP
jgi:Flp pilus assembly protein TadB